MIKIIIVAIIITPMLCLGQNEEYKLNELQHRMDSLSEVVSKIEKELVVIKDSIEKIEFARTQSNFKKVEINVLSISKIVDNADVRLNPSYAYDVIGKIVKGTEVEVLSVENDFFKVRFAGQIGYVETSSINDSKLNSLAKKVKKQNEFEYLSRKYGSTDARKIVNGQIWIGMTDAMARLSKGIPKDINRTKFEWGVHEQWIYGSFPDAVYLYFENGELTTIQD